MKASNKISLLDSKSLEKIFKTNFSILHAPIKKIVYVHLSTDPVVDSQVNIERNFPKLENTVTFKLHFIVY